MAIKSIRLQNFKGFKDAKLELKPLTVILGPNSAGKSCFGQALVALSKNNLSKDRMLSLAFEEEPEPSIDFGKYSDLIHAGCNGEHVKIELETNTWSLNLGFGGEITKNPLTKIGDLDLTYIEVGENAPVKATITEFIPLDTSQIINTGLTTESNVDFKNIKKLTRLNEKNWTISDARLNEDYKVFLNGLEIEGVYRLTGTTVQPGDVFPVIPFQDAANLLGKITYLRPDRAKPLRKYKNGPHNRTEEIDDWGNGAVWYAHEYRDKLVDTFDFLRPTSDIAEAAKMLNEVALQKKKQKKLSTAVRDWLVQLGLVSTFETTLVDGESAIEVFATPPKQSEARPLTDIGFGVSQVLPILVKGLAVEENGILVVEQPEAQLHPKPQSELADFFCAMVKCGRNVLVETHSEALFHRLRVLADMDEDLFEKIAIYFIDQSSGDADGVVRCSQPRKISLKPGDEFKWPTGFLYDGVETEMQVRATRIAKKKKEDKH